MLFKNFVQNPQDPNQLFSSEGEGGQRGKESRYGSRADGKLEVSRLTGS